MIKAKNRQGVQIWADKMRHCFCCVFAIGFFADLEDEGSLEDMTVTCPSFPKGDKLVTIGTDCTHFKNLRDTKVITGEKTCSVCGIGGGPSRRLELHGKDSLLCRPCHIKRHTHVPRDDQGDPAQGRMFNP